MRHLHRNFMLVIPAAVINFLVMGFLLTTFFISSAQALPDDSTQKMNIGSNESLINYKTGANTYLGHVTVDQGTTHLTSDRLTTQSNNKHKIQEAIAYGTLYDAHYWTTPKVNDSVLDAYAKVIKFYPQKSMVILEGNVYVTQGKNSFRGPIMIYNIKDQTVSAPASTKGRATIVIEPQALS